VATTQSRAVADLSGKLSLSLWGPFQLVPFSRCSVTSLYEHFPGHGAVDTVLSPVPAVVLPTFNYPGLLGSLKLFYGSLLLLTPIFVFPLAFSGVIACKERSPWMHKKWRQATQGWPLLTVFSSLTLN
jgi:hypothetical protein